MQTKEAIEIDAVTIGSDDVQASRRFLDEAFGVDVVRVSQAPEPSTGFRGFTLSLIFDQPADVDAAMASALRAGAEQVKPVAKSFWGYGGSLRAPDGTVWTLASSSKKNTAEPTGTPSSVVLLAGVDDVRASKKFYVERGLTVSRSFGAKYVEFETGTVGFALQSRKAVAKNAGVDAAGAGDHRLTVDAGAGEFVDPDGYRWE